MYSTKRQIYLLIVLLITSLFLLWGNYDELQILPEPLYRSRTGSQKQTHLVEIQIIPEINDTEINDTNSHASATTSEMSLVEPKVVYALNETISLKIMLFDQRNRPKTRGGDMLIVWMRDKSKGAASAGTVIDHDNGTYTGVLRILWSGQSVIRAAILSSREKMAFVHREFNNGYIGKRIECFFNVYNLTESTSGYMDNTFVKMRQVCNLTDKHYGVPLYCIKPKMKGIQCSDWTGITSQRKLPVPARADNKWYFSSAGPGILPGSVTVTVSSATNTRMTSQIPCSRTTFKNTWLSKPVGFFYNSMWNPLSCINNITAKDYDRCLANRTLRMFGDSTVRQLFSFMYKHMNLTWRIGPWQTGADLVPTDKWYSYSEAYKKGFNYTVFWSPHGLPMTFVNANRTAIRPSFVHLDEIPSGSRDIVLINLYAHFHFFPVHIFRSQMKRIRQAIKRLLIRSPDVKIAIKGPHYFVVDNVVTTLGSMWGPVYDKIIRQEFVHLYDHVIYLDVWDMLISVESSGIHPSEQILNTMLRTLFGYVCTK
ncbi:NXPE family member 3-like isoform X2 [Haliotis rufescens]|nr:NXPE family member 3-like isoform X2 [Haliotis rufescens]